MKREKGLRFLIKACEGGKFSGVYGFGEIEINEMREKNGSKVAIFLIPTASFTSIVLHYQLLSYVSAEM